jgi:hypothetical protein
VITFKHTKINENDEKKITKFIEKIYILFFLKYAKIKEWYFCSAALIAEGRINLNTENY